MAAQPTTAPVLSGPVPPLAVGFTSRQETGFRLADGFRPGETILLVPPPGGNPTAARARRAARPRPPAEPGRPSSRSASRTRCGPPGRSTCWSGWRPATGPRSWPATRAPPPTSTWPRRAAAGPAAAGAGTGETADAGAQRFLDWLRRTQRRWAVVLDGVTSPVDLDGLWPRGPAGQVVVTSRLPAQELADPGARRTAYGVTGFSRREAVGYLNTRLVSFPDQRIEALDLAEDIEGLPLAIAQAAARDHRGRGHLPGVPGRARAAAAHQRGRRHRRLPAVAARHLVARGRVRARDAAGRPGLARPRVRVHARHQRHPGGGADLPGRLRVHHRPARGRRGRAEPGQDRLRRPRTARAAVGRRDQPRAHGLAALQRPRPASAPT